VSSDNKENKKIFHVLFIDFCISYVFSNYCIVLHCLVMIHLQISTIVLQQNFLKTCVLRYEGKLNYIVTQIHVHLTAGVYATRKEVRYRKVYTVILSFIPTVESISFHWFSYQSSFEVVAYITIRTTTTPDITTEIEKYDKTLPNSTPLQFPPAQLQSVLVVRH